MFTNYIFDYLYSFIKKYSNNLAPAAIIKEAFDIFKDKRVDMLFKKSFVKI